MRTRALAVALLLPAAFARGEATGTDSSLEFPPIGCGNSVTGEEVGCHFQDADPQLMVTIEGPSQIEPGAFGGSYTVRLPEDYMGRLGAGVNVIQDDASTAGCQLDPFSSNLRVEPRPGSTDVLTHDGDDAPPTNLEGVWSYDFLVIDCQQPGTLILLAAMNAFDGDGTETGELWNKTELSVTVPEPGAAILAAAAAGALAALARRRARA